MKFKNVKVVSDARAIHRTGVTLVLDMEFSAEEYELIKKDDDKYACHRFDKIIEKVLGAQVEMSSGAVIQFMHYNLCKLVNRDFPKPAINGPQITVFQLLAGRDASEAFLSLSSYRRECVSKVLGVHTGSVELKQVELYLFGETSAAGLEKLNSIAE